MASHKYNNNSNLNRNLEKLSEIQSDISKILAVHEERLNQHEKTTETIVAGLEKRRIEINAVTSDFYKVLDTKADRIMLEIKENYVKTAEQHGKLRDRMVSFEKYIWMAIGASVGLSWIFSFVVNFHNLTK